MKITPRVFNIGSCESFLGKMLPDGRVTVPRIVILQLQQKMPDLKANFVEVGPVPV